ncbi:YbaB/EbfC family nucleoid-associated protein [Amycolatopsis acidicola]|uniref:YbaB/EbfC family nucleoid-associated protein n=1 Tax=Amycolatopsis acidicola TaxID=2596893 RepID=A0A5N0VBI5_9PSEU|nr:YbaB/EbfC family nucleoid-associated protein [Amycolatopsis acidicola]KAA9162928.1 YbaB/EbfC family nucleoid-associated protein [Amycolatopsis acidicola]
MSAEFDQLVAQFEQFQSKLHRVDEQLTDVGQMQQEITGLTATAKSPDGAVTVVAGPGGAIQDIRFADNALRQSTQALSASVMSTLQQAVAEVARKQAKTVEAHLGTGMNLLDQVLETQAELFGTSPEQLRASLEEESRPPVRDEDMSEQTFLHREEPQRRPAPPTGGNDSSGSRFLNLYDEEDR